jgi:hypothetical protein
VAARFINSVSLQCHYFIFQLVQFVPVAHTRPALGACWTPVIVLFAAEVAAPSALCHRPAVEKLPKERKFMDNKPIEPTGYVSGLWCFLVAGSHFIIGIAVTPFGRILAPSKCVG